MNALLMVVLVLHIFFAVVSIGGITIATSVFPRFVSTGGEGGGTDRRRDVATELHRITVFYGRSALVVPLLGLLLALATGRLTEPWVLSSVLLVAAGGALLSLRTVPLQRAALQGAGGPATIASLRAAAGLTNLLWLSVLVLMVVRPGGTT